MCCSKFGMSQITKIIAQMHSLASNKHVNVMEHLTGEKQDNVDCRIGVPIGVLRKIAYQIKYNPDFAATLWQENYIEAKQLSCLVEDPKTVKRETLDSRINDINTWDVCDLFCQDLVIKTNYLPELGYYWINKERAVTQRAGWVCCAEMAIHRPDEWYDKISSFYSIIDTWTGSSEKIVIKAVSWALRETGKRIREQKNPIILIANEMIKLDNYGKRWIGKDVIRELTKQ